MEMVCRNGRMAGVNCGERPPSQGAGAGRGGGGRDKAGRGGHSAMSSELRLCARHLTELMLRRQTVLK